MPELPEVETVKNVLLPIVKGQTITSIDVIREKTIVSDLSEFKEKLLGQTFLDVTRIGKFLIFHLTNDLVILSHLRMEGKYFEYEENEPNSYYSRVVFHFASNHKLCYDDSRCFGVMKLTTEQDYKNEKEIAQLGPEPFDIKDASYIVERTKKSRLPIKSTLLDQTLMCGLGNIYADETLFASKIYPLTPACEITKNEWEVIVSNASKILSEAIEAGGSTIRSYHPGKDIDGNFQSALMVYGHKGEKCPTCGHVLHFTKVGGRGTTYCPICQCLKKDKIIIGITGKIASGKSTVLKIAGEQGYPTISSDEIVDDLYKNSKVLAEKISQKLNISFENGLVDKSILRDHLIAHPKDQSKLEKLVHPMVRDEIVKQVNSVKSGLIFVEVPLLFESHMENLFDFTLAIDVDEYIQIERLEKRNPSSSHQLKLINRNNKFEAYKNVCDFVISNDKDEKSFESEISNLINKLKGRLK